MRPQGPGRAMRLAVALVALLLLPTAAAHEGPFVDVDPAAELGLFPTPDEVALSLEKALDHPWARLVPFASSVDGRPLVALEVTDRESAVPMEERVVTFLMTQQHGNEPAGTGAAVEWIDDLVAGEVDPSLFADQVLVLLPMVNPDGAAANARENADGVDINRDHVALETPEARTVHDILARWDVHFAIDHHEYGGTGLGNPVPIRLYDYDLTSMAPNHGNVREPTRSASEAFMYDALWPAAEAAGFTANEYGEQTVAGIPVQQVAGGPDPGILRNSFGLNHVAGLLVETRVDAVESPFHDAARRIAIHRLTIDTAIAYAHENRAELIAAKRESERQSLEAPAKEYVEGEARGAMPAAFRVATSVDELMSRHALPAGVPVEDGMAYSLANERQGLLAAILHPKSTRAVTAAVAMDVAPNVETIAPLSAPERQVPAPIVALLAAAIVVALLRRN